MHYSDTHSALYVAILQCERTCALKIASVSKQVCELRLSGNQPTDRVLPVVKLHVLVDVATDEHWRGDKKKFI